METGVGAFNATSINEAVALVMPADGTVIVVHIFVLLAGLGSGGVAGLRPCDTVAQFQNVPPCGTLKENKAVPDSLGCITFWAVHEIGRTGPAPGEQLKGREPPAPVNVETGGALGVSVKLSGATDATWPMFLMVTVQSTDCCGPLTHTFVTLKSGPPGGPVTCAWAAAPTSTMARAVRQWASGARIVRICNCVGSVKECFIRHFLLKERQA